MSRLCVLAILLAGASDGCSSADRADQNGAHSGATARSAPTSGAKSSSASRSSGAPGGASAANPGRDSLMAAADRGRILGADSAPVWLLVVSDFQCPWCKQWHDSTFPAIRKQYVDAGRIRVAYLNFPLRIHPNAMPAAMAAMCASAQGKFWAAHDRLFDTQKKWEALADPTAFLDSLAAATGADRARLRDCTRGRQLAALIEGDQARAERAGAESTPTFFVGSRKIEGAKPLADFRRIIDSVLAARR